MGRSDRRLAHHSQTARTPPVTADTTTAAPNASLSATPVAPAKRTYTSWFRYDEPTPASSALAAASQPLPAAVAASATPPTKRSYTSWFRYDDQTTRTSTAAANPSAPTQAAAASPAEAIKTSTAPTPSHVVTPGRSYSSWFRYDEPTHAVIQSKNDSASAVLSTSSSLAPPPPLSTLSAQHTPTTFRTVAPILLGLSVLMGGSVAYGLRYGRKQAAKVEETYAAQQWEVKPSEVEVEITPEMRRYALRRATLALGYGTALSLGTAGLIGYGVSRQWEVYTFKELGAKLSTIFTGVRLPFESTATRIVEGFEAWVERSWFGQNWSSSTPTRGSANSSDGASSSPSSAAANALIQAQEAELAAMWRDVRRDQEEWAKGNVESMDRKKRKKVTVEQQQPGDSAQQTEAATRNP